jgi:membrane-bound lytic murein transglycosylase B
MNGFAQRVGLLIITLVSTGALSAATVDRAAVNEARDAFIDRMVTTHGFDRDELSETLADAEISEDVLQAISRPAERVLEWHEYRAIFLTEARIAGGVEFWASHADEIRVASERFGVAPELLVAILGVETFFGERMGRFRVLDSLATLAFAYPPRSEFFSSELEAYLLLSREEGTDPRALLGSYAGAMGAGQFIPSSFRAYAVDGNGDGQRNLWTDWQDILASVANYFRAHGWKQGEPVVERATRAPGWSGEEPVNSMNLDETVASLSRQGYVFSTELPESAPTTALSLAGESEQEYWIGYHNFRVITRYNRSVKYALAAYQLGQAILSEFQKLRSRPVLERGV